MSSVIGARDGAPVFIACNTEEFRRAEVPAAGVLTSARGLSAMYAALHHDMEGQPPLLDADTVDAVSQQQVSGHDMIGTMPSTFAIVFQKPTAHHPFGSFRAFGHDGLGGSLGFSDPTHDLSFGYVVQRIPLPGGADRRAIELSQAVRRCLH
jgi:CubicO group peptidase (beta-lactamase class C family)